MSSIAAPTEREVKRAQRTLRWEASEGLREPARYAAAHETLGRQHAARQQHAQAADHFERALRLRPSAATYAALAATLWPTGQYARRLELLTRAVALAPTLPEYRVHRAEMLLTLGRWAEAWPEYALRHQVEGFDHATGCQTLGLPRWQGEPLEGQRLIVVHEGGYGDVLNFCRYGPLIRKRGAGRTILRCPAGLVPLLGSTPLFDRVCSNDEMPPPADLEIALMSLPGVFGTVPDSIPWDGPYLPRPTPPVVHRPWRIGLVWQGAPHNPTDAVRSIPMVELARWLGSKPPGLWYSLQYGSEWEPMLGPVAGFKDFLVWPTLTSDWRHTAQLLSSMDLLLSVDTAMVHLAGAMGVPCWALLSSSNDWRWLLEREDTPWYPSVRLFRMTHRGGWPALLRRVREELEAAHA